MVCWRWGKQVVGELPRAKMVFVAGDRLVPGKKATSHSAASIGADPWPHVKRVSSALAVNHPAGNRRHT